MVWEGRRRKATPLSRFDVKTMKLLTFLISLIAVLPVRGDSGDDTLKYYLSKSDLVVVGKITSDPIGIVDESFAPHYILSVRHKETTT